MTWSQTPIRLSEFTSKRKGNCNVMRSYDQFCDRSNLIRTTSYYNLLQGWLSHQSPDLLNLLNHSFGSTFWINLLINLCNQSSHWISGATGLWSPIRQGVRCITLKYFLMAMWIKVLLDITRTSPLCKRQLYLFSINVRTLTRNDKGLLMGRPVAPRFSDKYVSLDLTWLDTETFVDVCLELWSVSG